MGIPLIVMADIIHGYKMIFPIPLAMGASWNLELTKDISYIGPKNKPVIEAGGFEIHVGGNSIETLKEQAWFKL